MAGDYYRRLISSFRQRQVSIPEGYTLLIFCHVPTRYPSTAQQSTINVGNAGQFITSFNSTLSVNNFVLPSNCCSPTGFPKSPPIRFVDLSVDQLHHQPRRPKSPSSRIPQNHQSPNSIEQITKHDRLRHLFHLVILVHQCHITGVPALQFQCEENRLRLPWSTPLSPLHEL